MAAGSQLVEFAGFVLTGASFVGSLVTQYLEHPGDKYETKVKKLQKDRWSALSTELGELMVEIEGVVENGDGYSREDAPREAKYSLVIQKEYNKDQLGDVFQQIEDVNTPKDLFKRARETRDAALERFVAALALSIVGVGIVLFVQESGEFGQFILVIGGYAFLSGLNQARVWRNTRQELDEMWEDYELL